MSKHISIGLNVAQFILLKIIVNNFQTIIKFLKNGDKLKTRVVIHGMHIHISH